MSDASPKYITLYEDMRRKITQGAWPYGTKLPSRRQTAEEQGLSVITVEHSYDLLCQEGYIESRPRSGYYVCYRPSEAFAPAEGAHEALAPYAPMKRDDTLFPYSVMARAMRKTLSEQGERILSKPENQGCMGLRGALSRYLARNRGMKVSAEQIVIGSGAEYLYGLIVEMLGRDRRFGIESPSYEKIEQVYLSKGVKVDLLPLGHDGIRSQALKDTGADVLHITPFRSYPTGVTASASKRAAYIQWAARDGRYIVEDDFESEFSLMRKPEETVFALTDRDNVIYLNTFSRTISPALRIGYMVLPESLMPLFQRTVAFYSCPVPAFEQYLLQELLDSGDFEKHINRIRRRKRRESGA